VPKIRSVSVGCVATCGSLEQINECHMGFVVDKAALGQVFSENFGFPFSSFHRLLHTHRHSSSGACTIDQLVADVTSGISFTHTHIA
jgi:hypothetical protein